MNDPDPILWGKNPTDQKNFQPENPIIDPDHTGLWIPNRYIKAEDLSRAEIFLVALILSLSKNEIGVCYASNEYLGKYLGLSKGRLANLLIEVKKKGYVRQLSWDGRVRHLKVLR